MDPIQDSTWQYANASHIAWEYDDYYEDLALFAYDTRVLDETLTEPGSLIDLGCGTGRHVLHLAKRGFDITGIDLSPFMLDVAREKIDHDGLHARLVQGSITDLSGFEDGAFRYAICMFSTLGLISGRENRRQFLSEVRRILAPGGLFIFHVHNRLHRVWDHDGRMWLLRSTFINPFQELEAGDMVGEYRGIPDMYLHIFSPGEAKRLARSAGLRLRRVIPLNGERSGPLAGSWFASLRANGLIVVAER